MTTRSPRAIPVTLPDGESVRVRPIMPGDRTRLAEAFQELSESSRYQRFLTPMARLSSSQLSYLTDIDHVDHFAWGVENSAGRGIAVARYVRTEGSTAEAAFTIVDDYQGRGLGWLLLRALCLTAADRGLRRFEMTMLADNAAMAALARRAGATFEQPTDGTVTANLALDPAVWSGLPKARAFRELAARARRAA